MSNNLYKQTKEDLCNYIDNLNITSSNYDIFLNLYKSTDEKLFTKIIEEMKDGNIVASDFTRLFADNNFLEESIDNQLKLFRENKLLKELTGETALTNLISINKSAPIIEKENIFNQIAGSSGGSELEQLYKANLLNKLLTETSSDVVNSLLLSLDEYTVPVDYEHIILSEYDKNFAKKNLLSDNEMKKLKSFAAWTSNFFEN